MADVKKYPPRQMEVILKLYYKDLAELMLQAADNTEVLTFLQTAQLEHIIFQLQTEHQTRSDYAVTSSK